MEFITSLAMGYMLVLIISAGGSWFIEMFE